MIDALATKLADLGATVLKPDYGERGVHLDVTLAPEKVREAVITLRDGEFLIESLTCLDFEPELMVVHHYTHTEDGCRVALRALTDRENPEVPTISDIFQGANWHEREAHDFYGVKFTGHPDMTPLILPEDSGDLNPLRKEVNGLKTPGDVFPELAPEPAETEEATDK